MDNKYPNRLRELREEYKISGISVAEKLAITPQYYYDLETGRRRLNEDTIRQLADLFHVSTDFLLGRTGFRLGESEEAEMLKVLSPEALAEVRKFVQYIRMKMEGKINDY